MPPVWVNSAVDPGFEPARLNKIVPIAVPEPTIPDVQRSAQNILNGAVRVVGQLTFYLNILRSAATRTRQPQDSSSRRFEVLRSRSHLREKSEVRW